MDKILIVAKREYLERVRSRWFIVITLAVPALMAVVFAIMIMIASKSTASSNVRHIRILDATGTSLGERVSQNLMADSGATSDGVRPIVEHVSVADLGAMQDRATSDAVVKNGLTGFLVLTDSTMTGRSFYYAGRNASSVADVDRLQTAVRQSVSIVRLQREGLTDSVVSAFNNMPLKMRSERITDAGRGGSGQAGIIAGVLVGVLLFMSIIIHGQNVLRGVLEEKASRVAEVVISSVKPEVLLAGKVLGVGAVGLTQQVAWIGIGAYLSNFILPVVLKNFSPAAASAATASGGGSPLAGALGGISLGVVAVAIGFFLVGFTFYASLYAAAGSMVNSEQEAQQAAVPVMLLIMSAWLMVNPVMINPNSRLAVVMSWLPWSSPIIMPMRMGLTSVSPLEVGGSILVALLGCVGAVWLSARIYRVGMLMYGKKPSLGEVAKWIRYA
jgi:ABC-2 type transport system permease protein